MPSSADAPNASFEFIRQIDGLEYVYYGGDLRDATRPLTTDRVVVAALATYSFSLMLGVFGNGICIFIMFADEKNKGIRHFLVSLALADILFLAMSVPMKFIVVFFHTWELGAVVCKLEPCVEFMACAASVFNIVAVTIESPLLPGPAGQHGHDTPNRMRVFTGRRFVVIVMPFKARTCCSPGRSKWTAVFVWALAAVCSLPAVLLKRAEVFGLFNESGYALMTICTYRDASEYGYMWYRLAALFVLPMTIVSSCYIAVIRVLRRSNAQHYAMTAHGSHGKLATGKFFNPGQSSERVHAISSVVFEGRNQVVKMLGVIMLTFCVCWGPRLIVSIANTAATEHEVSSEYGYSMMNFKFIANVLPYIHSCLNPIIYCAMSASFRESARSAAAKYCSRFLPQRLLGDWRISTPRSVTSNIGDHSCTASNRCSLVLA